LENQQLDKEQLISIDIGVNNFISAVSNKENIRSFIVNGNPIKAFNQWVNKLSAKLQSEGKEKEYKTLWKYRKINQFFASITNFLKI